MSIISGILDYVESVENHVYASVSDVSAEMPMIKEALHRLWVDVSRFGPTLPDLHIPGLGDFEVPPPPPPPPPPKSLLENSADWISDHPWKASIGVGIVGVGLLVGYNSVRSRANARLRKKGTSSNERRQVIVVLGGDTPLASPLIHDLEQKGYIVIVSVATPEAGDELETTHSNGYVKALVLNPTELGTIPIFLRSLASTLSRRFPINAPGDPHASPATLPYIHSIISLLTLPSASALPPAPLEHLHLRNEYLPYFTATHLAPLQVIQALLPMLRTAPSRARDATANGAGQRSIVVCIPAAEARVGLPFAAAHAMSAAATSRGAEVLRREIHIAALTSASDSMSDIRVVVVDVGSVESPRAVRRLQLTYDMRRDMDGWTASEKLAYGPAYESLLEEGHHYKMTRKPTDVRVFVERIADIVGGSYRDPFTIFGYGFGLKHVLRAIRGDRITVGAGATTYMMASYLPTSILDVILNLPHFLLSVRNALLPVPPRITLPSERGVPFPVPAAAATAPRDAAAPVQAEKQGADSSANASDLDISETGSEVDVESNAGEGVGDSWVSLKSKESHVSSGEAVESV